MTEQGVCPSEEEMQAEETIAKLQRQVAVLVPALAALTDAIEVRTTDGHIVGFQHSPEYVYDAYCNAQRALRMVVTEM